MCGSAIGDGKRKMSQGSGDAYSSCSSSCSSTTITTSSCGGGYGGMRQRVGRQKKGLKGRPMGWEKDGGRRGRGRGERVRQRRPVGQRSGGGGGSGGVGSENHATGHFSCGPGRRCKHERKREGGRKFDVYFSL